MREITQGQIYRYERRAISLRGEKAFNAWWVEWCSKALHIGRRAHLKALLDFMTPLNRRQMQRAANRRVAARTSYIGGL